MASSRCDELVDRLFTRENRDDAGAIQRVLATLCERALDSVEERDGIAIELRERLAGLRTLTGDDPEGVVKRAGELRAVEDARINARSTQSLSERRRERRRKSDPAAQARGWVHALLESSIAWLSYQDDDDWVTDVAASFVEFRVFLGASEEAAVAEVEELAIQHGLIRR